MKRFLYFLLLLMGGFSLGAAGDVESFFAAVRSGNSQRVEEMLAKDKILVFSTDKQGLTPFLVAVQTRNLKMTSLLADYFARLGNTAAPGNAFHIAVSNEDEPMVRLLVRLTSEEDSNMPQYLINMPRQRNNSALADKNTPLHLAAQKCNFRIYQYLVKNGANPNVRNSIGKTPKQIISACPKPEAKKKKDVSEQKPAPQAVRTPVKIQDPPPLVFPVN